MRIGVIFPQDEIGKDPGVIREYAQAVEEMGYTHILATDHVLGASTANRPDWRPGITRMCYSGRSPQQLRLAAGAVESSRDLGRSGKRVGYLTATMKITHSWPCASTIR